MSALHNIYKKGLFTLFILSATTISAQQIRTSYFMKTSNARTEMNPSFQPEKGFVSIPVLGALGASYGTNGVAVENFIYHKDGQSVTFMDNSISAETFLNGLKPNNQINMDFGTQILSGGWYAGKGFWTVNISAKGLVNLNAPKSLFEFMKLGNGSKNTYDIRDIKFYAESYIETGVGYSRPINEKLSIGGKIKLLFGAGSINGNIDRLYAEMNDNSWKVTANGSLQTNFKGLMPKWETDEKGNEYYNSFDFDSPGLSGFGFGIDLGANYKLTENITVSAAILDLGFIGWNKESSSFGNLNGTFDFNGFDLVMGNNNENIPDMSDQFEGIKEDFENLLHFTGGEQKGNRTRLRSTLNIGAEYRMLEEKLGFGLLSSTKFYTPRAYTELTLSGNYRPVKWFEAALSYSFIHSKFKTYGIALNFSPSWINFFIGSDYMFTKVTPQMLPVSANATNVYMGISVPLN